MKSVILNERFYIYTPTFYKCQCFFFAVLVDFWDAFPYSFFHRQEFFDFKNWTLSFNQVRTLGYKPSNTGSNPVGVNSVFFPYSSMVEHRGSTLPRWLLVRVQLREFGLFAGVAKRLKALAT